MNQTIRNTKHPTKSASHSSAQESAPQKSALQIVFWATVAWLVGTFVFEVVAVGATFEAFGTEQEATNKVEIDLFQTLMNDETDVCMTVTPLEGLYSVERNSLMRRTFESVIKLESQKLALLQSIRRTPKLDPATELDPEAIATDPIIAGMPIADGEFKMVYEEMAGKNDAQGLTEKVLQGLAWDDAQKSSLPGLVRLTGYVGSFFPPVHVDEPKVPAKKTLLPKISKPFSTNIQPKIATFRLQNDASPFKNASHRFREKQVEEGIVVVGPVTAPILPEPVLPKGDSKAALMPKPKNDFIIPQIVQAPVEDLSTKTHVRMSASDALEPPVVAPVSEPIRQPATEPIRQPDARVAAQLPGWNDILPTPAPAPAAATAAPSSPDDPGVTLQVDNTDVRTVLDMLARGYDMNIMIAPDVKGTVTANVSGLTPDQALKSVLTMCNLRAQAKDNVIFVFSADKLPSDARDLRLFPLDFATAETLESTVQTLLSPIGIASITSLDSENNLKTREAIFVIDTPEAIQRVESFLYQADQPPRQVMIEAKILEIELSDDMMHGVNFDAIFRGDLTVGGFGLADPIASRTNPLFYAQVDGTRVKSLIDLLETTTDAKTLASPKVMVVNGQNAKIQVGQQLGFSVATVTQTSTVQDVKFLDTGVVLNVTPTISRDNKIMLDVKPEVSSGQINPTTLLPEEETRELETSVLLNNHQGVVIGGLIQEEDRVVVRKLPWLGDIKYVGKMFQRRETERSRTEIIVALIPHIVNLDECHQPMQKSCEELNSEFERTNSPLFFGPLQRNCRPEPRLPDSASEHPHLDVNRINRMLP